MDSWSLWNTSNEKADQNAKKATSKNHIDYNLPLTITETKHQLKNHLRQKWQLYWNESKDSIHKLIKPAVYFHINSWNLPCWQEIVIHRLRMDTCNSLNCFYYKIGKHPDGICEICHTYDNINHFFTSCKKICQQQKKLKSLKFNNNQMTLKSS